MSVSGGGVAVAVQVYVADVEGLVAGGGGGARVLGVQHVTGHTLPLAAVHRPVHLRLAAPPLEAQHGEHHQHQDQGQQAHEYQAYQTNLCQIWLILLASFFSLSPC